jgi:predicted amidophosphoribosyltransferase
LFFLIWLIFRKKKKKCSECGKKINKDMKVCPYCGKKQKYINKKKKS